MSENTFQSEFKNVNMKKACKALSKRRQKTGSFWSSQWGLYTQMAIFVLMAIFIEKTIGSELIRSITRLFLLAGLCMIFFIGSQKTQSAIYDSPIRAGLTTFRLSAEGYHTEHPGYESLMRWSHVPDVLVTDQGLLFVHSDYEYFPIEAKAFRDHDEMVATAKQVKQWIAAAQS